MMKQKIWLALWLLTLAPGIGLAQRAIISDIKQISGTIEFVLDSGYLMEHHWIGYPKQRIKTSIHKKGQKQLAVELIYFKNNTFSYSEFDATGQVSQQGIYYSDTNSQRDIMFNVWDWHNDPDGSKGLGIDYTLLDGLVDVKKEGFWLERVSDNAFFKFHSGFYRNGVKDGLWELSRTTPIGKKAQIFPPDSIAEYANGEHILSRKAKAASSDSSALIQKTWYQTSFNNNELSFSLAPKYPYELEALNFFSPNFFHGRFYNFSIPFESGEWQFKDGLIWFIHQNKKVSFIITQLNKSMLQMKKQL